jgi:SAM-dependent methyltransferase
MWLPRPVKRLLVPVYNRLLAYRSSRERSVRNIALANDREAFETIFADAELVQEYLVAERLDFYENVAAFCERFAFRSVVDEGCGTGHLLAAVARRSPGIDRLTGIDFAAAAIERLGETLPEAEGVVASVYDLTFPESAYDLVICTEVLEHLDRPGDAIAALVRLCAERGRIVLTVPDGALDTYGGHVNFWSLAAFGEFLRPYGRAEVSRLDDVLVGVLEPG